MPRKKSGLSDTSRKTEIVTVRLDSRLKYLAELAARRQRRPLSSYIEWAVAESLSRVPAAYDPGREGPDTFADEASALWDVDERDRFVKLALRYPDLLDVEEQRLWKLIRENGSLWRGRYSSGNGEWQWSVEEAAILWDRLREHWENFKKVARGEAEQSTLPTWNKYKPPDKPRVPPKATTPQDLDEEIPF